MAPRRLLPSARVRVATVPAVLHGLMGLVVSLAGCGTAAPPAKKTMTIAEVPPAFMETARKTLPGITFDEVWVKKDGTLEIRGRAKDGKVREVEIRPDGTVEEIE